MRIATFYLLLVLYAVSARAQSPRVLTVEEAITRAQEHSPERLRAESLERHADRLRESSRSFFPSRPELEVEYMSERPFGERDYEFSLGLSQAIPIWGTQSKRRAVAESFATAAEAERSSLGRRIEITTRSLYNRAWVLLQQVALGNSLIASSTKLVDASNKRLQAGDMSVLDRNTIVLEANKQAIEHERVHSEYEQAIGELEVLTGLDLSDVVFDVDPRLISASAIDTVSNYYTLSPDWIRLDNQIRISEARLELAKSELLADPRIGLLYSQDLLTIDGEQIKYMTGAQQSIDRIEAPGRSAGVRLSMQLPITIPWLWSADMTEVAEREAEIRMLQADQASLRIELAGKLARLRPRIERIHKAMLIYEGSLQLIEQNHELLDRGYAGGELSVTELLVGRQQLTQLQSEHLDLIREMRETEIELQIILNP